MHNLIWGDNSNNGQQPSWVLNGDSANGLLDQAYLGTDPNAAADLRGEISERIDYYVGTGTASDRAHKYVEIDIYNESYHTGSDPGSHGRPQAQLLERLRGRWDRRHLPRSARAVAVIGATAKVFVNEYGSIGGADYGTWYMNHIEQIRQAGVTAGYGDVVDGIGIQHYPGGSQNPGNIFRTIQNLSVQGLPLSLTEFGVSNGVSQATAATILGDILKVAFGTADATGFFMWGFHQESGTGATTLFAPSAALYTVNTSNFNAWTLTPAGQKWQDQLGIADWDANPNNGWTTQLNATVGADGTINFNGFWGDYELTINGQPYSLTLDKGTGLYSLVVAAGDYNGDHVVDSTDYIIWRDTVGSLTDLRADGNGDKVVDDADYGVWMSRFGVTYGSGTNLASIPEPGNFAMAFTAVVSGWMLVVRPSRRSA